jgi:hypothetical protein
MVKEALAADDGLLGAPTTMAAAAPSVPRRPFVRTVS